MIRRAVDFPLNNRLLLLVNEICSDSQRPLTRVIVGGLIVNLVMSVFLPPTQTNRAAR